MIAFIVAFWAHPGRDLRHRRRVRCASSPDPAGAGSSPGGSWPWSSASSSLFNPAALLVSLLWLVAIWAIMAGIVFAIASFFVRKAGNVIVEQTAG